LLRSGIPIGRAFGIPLKLHWSWFIIFALVVWALTVGYFPAFYPDWSVALSVAAAVVTSLLFFASILAHELMHSLFAKSTGLTVRSITLFVFGGVSQLAEEPKQAKDEFRIALAGPLTSLVLGAIFWAIWFWSRGSIDFLAAIAYWLGLINVFVAGFNLIPGFPLDGGRVLRSILWGRSGNLRRATRTASNIGRGFGYLFIFGGIALIFWGSWFNGLWLAFIGWFLQSSAVSSYRELAIQDMLKGHKVSVAMTRDCVPLDADLTVDELVHRHILTSGRRCFPVAIDNRVVGLVTVHNTKGVPRERWSTETVGQIMIPIDKVEWVRPDESLSTALQLLTEADVNQLPVIDDGAVVGMIARDNILSFIGIRAELGV
jgi:Zn-dependent protease/CBS domain-containing protein